MLEISVIVPARNSERTIRECVTSLLRQTGAPSHEVIVVDDGSEDNTAGIAEASAAHIIESDKPPTVKIIQTKHGGPAHARNIGISEAKGERVAFLDADAKAPHTWLRDLAAHQERVFGGRLIRGFSDEDLYNTELEEKTIEFEQARRDTQYGDARREAVALPSCNLIIEKKILEEVGGFDEDFKHPSAEDYELCLRIRDRGYKIIYDPSIVVLHRHQKDFQKVLEKARMHGRENVLLRKKRGENLLNETLRLMKTPTLPLIAYMRYPKGFKWMGMMYELEAMRGQIDGIRRYWL